MGILPSFWKAGRDLLGSLHAFILASRGTLRTPGRELLHTQQCFRSGTSISHLWQRHLSPTKISRRVSSKLFLLEKFDERIGEFRKVTNIADLFVSLYTSSGSSWPRWPRNVLTSSALYTYLLQYSSVVENSNDILIYKS